MSSVLAQFKMPLALLAAALSRSGLTGPGDVCEMLAWENREFSFGAAVRAGSQSRRGWSGCCSRLLHVRFLQHSYRWQANGGCLYMADSSPQTRVSQRLLLPTELPGIATLRGDA
jgi:hypothetical protein